MKPFEKFSKKNATPLQEAKASQQAVAEAPVSAPAVQKEHKEPYLTQTVVFGAHLYRRPGDDSSVFFVDENRGIRKMIVDSEGNIQNFPGIVKENFWTYEVTPHDMEPRIHYRTEFRKRGNRWLMHWQIQPDGQYWGDDGGFGMEHDEEVILYSYIDENGDFTAPFQIYAVGSRYYTFDRFESAIEQWYAKDLEKLLNGSLASEHYDSPEDYLFPRFWNTPAYSDARNDYCIWTMIDVRKYWNRPLLSQKLLEATEALLALPSPLEETVAYYRRSRIHASMTLFSVFTGDPRFQAVLDKFFKGAPEKGTERFLQKAQEKGWKFPVTNTHRESNEENQ